MNAIAKLVSGDRCVLFQDAELGTYSRLCRPASLLAPCDLSADKGHDSVAGNTTRESTRFVRQALHQGHRVLSPEGRFVVSKLAESRNEWSEQCFVRGLGFSMPAEA